MFRPKVERIEYGGAMCGDEERDAMLRIFDSQKGKRWTIGPESEAFEQELAITTRVNRAVVVNSGSSALLLAVAALKLPKGSNIVIPALNFPTAFNAIIQNGHIPMVLDVDLETMNLSLDEVKKAVANGNKIDAVIAVNVAGNPVDLVGLRMLLSPETKIILDNCDGYGTTVDEMFVDARADMACVSFHAAHIITMGEGGAVLTNSEEYADRVKKMREWGRASGTDKIYEYTGFPTDYRERYVYEEIGYNLKPLELQCAIGRIQLTKLQDFKNKRRHNFNYLMNIFQHLPKFVPVTHLENADTCWFSFPFMCRGVERKLVMETLEANNIECRTIFSGNILKHPAYEGVNVTTPNDPHRVFQNATDIMFNGVFISVHPSITDEMMDFIGEVLKSL